MQNFTTVTRSYLKIMSIIWNEQNSWWDPHIHSWTRVIRNVWKWIDQDFIRCIDHPGRFHTVLRHSKHHICLTPKQYAVRMEVMLVLVSFFHFYNITTHIWIGIFVFDCFFQVGSGPPSLQNEFDNIQTVERSAETDTLKQTNQATSPQSDQQSPVHSQPPPIAGRSTTKNEKRSANTLYQELSFQDNEESEENEVTGKINNN